MIQVHYIVENVDNPKYAALRIVFFILVLSILVISIGAYGCIWHYERYGGDPQKRTILNQLIGLYALSTIFGYLTNVSAFLYRLAFQPIPLSYATATFFMTSFVTCIACFLILDEIVILRFLSTFWWKQFPPINDDFFAVFLFLTNYGIALLFMSMGHMGTQMTILHLL